MVFVLCGADFVGSASRRAGTESLRGRVA